MNNSFFCSIYQNSFQFSFHDIREADMTSLNDGSNVNQLLPKQNSGLDTNNVYILDEYRPYNQNCFGGKCKGKGESVAKITCENDPDFVLYICPRCLDNTFKHWKTTKFRDTGCTYAESKNRIVMTPPFLADGGKGPLDSNKVPPLLAHSTNRNKFGIAALASILGHDDDPEKVYDPTVEGGLNTLLHKAGLFLQPAELGYRKGCDDNGTFLCSKNRGNGDKRFPEKGTLTYYFVYRHEGQLWSLDPYLTKPKQVDKLTTNSQSVRCKRSGGIYNLVKLAKYTATHCMPGMIYNAPVIIYPESEQLYLWNIDKLANVPPVNASTFQLEYNRKTYKIPSRPLRASRAGKSASSSNMALTDLFQLFKSHHNIELANVDMNNIISVSVGNPINNLSYTVDQQVIKLLNVGLCHNPNRDGITEIFLSAYSSTAEEGIKRKENTEPLDVDRKDAKRPCPTREEGKQEEADGPEAELADESDVTADNSENPLDGEDGSKVEELATDNNSNPKAVAFTSNGEESAEDAHDTQTNSECPTREEGKQEEADGPEAELADESDVTADNSENPLDGEDGSKVEELATDNNSNPKAVAFTSNGEESAEDAHDTQTDSDQPDDDEGEEAMASNDDLDRLEGQTTRLRGEGRMHRQNTSATTNTSDGSSAKEASGHKDSFLLDHFNKEVDCCLCGKQVSTGYRLVKGKKGDTVTTVAHTDCAYNNVIGVERSNVFGAKMSPFGTLLEDPVYSKANGTLEPACLQEKKENGTWTHKGSVSFPCECRHPNLHHVYKKMDNIDNIVDNEDYDALAKDYETNPLPIAGREYCSNLRRAWCETIKQATNANALSPYGHKKITRQLMSPYGALARRGHPNVKCCFNDNEFEYLETFTSGLFVAKIVNLPESSWFCCPYHTNKSDATDECVKVSYRHYCNAYMVQNDEKCVIFQCYSCGYEFHYSRLSENRCDVCGKSDNTFSRSYATNNASLLDKVRKTAASVGVRDAINKVTDSVKDKEGTGDNAAERYIMAFLRNGGDIDLLSDDPHIPLRESNGVLVTSCYDGKFPSGTGNKTFNRGYQIYKDKFETLRQAHRIHLVSVDDTLRSLQCSEETYLKLSGLFGSYFDYIITSSQQQEVISFFKKYGLSYIVAPVAFTFSSDFNPHEETFKRIYDDAYLASEMDKEVNVRFVLNALCNFIWQEQLLSKETKTFMAADNLSEQNVLAKSKEAVKVPRKTESAPCVCCINEEMHKANQEQKLVVGKARTIKIHQAKVPIDPLKRYGSTDQNQKTHFLNHCQFLSCVTSRDRIFADFKEDRETSSKASEKLIEFSATSSKANEQLIFPLKGLVQCLWPRSTNRQSEKKKQYSNCLQHFLTFDDSYQKVCILTSGILSNVTTYLLLGYKNESSALRRYFDHLSMRDPHEKILHLDTVVTNVKGPTKSYKVESLQDALRQRNEALCTRLEKTKFIQEFAKFDDAGCLKTTNQLALRKAIRDCIVDLFSTDVDEDSSEDEKEFSTDVDEDSSEDEKAAKKAIEVIANRIAFALQTFIISHKYDWKKGYK